MRGYKFLLWKRYFDTGFSLLNYVKYVVAIVGVGAMVKNYSMIWVFIVAVIYGIICLILGKLWFKYRLIDTENEISNKFNPFQREVRKHMKNRNI